MTSAPSRRISSFARSVVLCGTTTITGRDSSRPANATAIPAFPPDDASNRTAPRRRYSSHAWPTPRILNEPGGCSASSFNHTLREAELRSFEDCKSGVSMCSGFEFMGSQPYSRRPSYVVSPNANRREAASRHRIVRSRPLVLSLRDLPRLGKRCCGTRQHVAFPLPRRYGRRQRLHSDLRPRLRPHSRTASHRGICAGTALEAQPAASCWRGRSRGGAQLALERHRYRRLHRLVPDLFVLR